MKRIFIATLLVAIGAVMFLVSSPDAYAASNPIIPVCNDGNTSGTNASTTAVCEDVNSQSSSDNPVIGIIRAAVEVISYIAGAAVIILILVSSIRFLTSSGDSGKVSQAKNGLIYALVGIIIVAFSQAIISFVLDKV